MRKIPSLKCFWEWEPSLLLEDDLFVGRGRTVTHVSTCMNVCTGSGGPADLGFLLSGSWEEENLGMYVQMIQPEPHCQGLGVRISDWQCG